MARASARPPLSGRINCGVIESLTHAAPPQVKKIFRHRTWAVTTVVHWQRSRLAVAAVAEPGKRAGGALEGRGGEVERDKPAFFQMALGEPFLDCLLPLGQPIHACVKLVLMGIGYAEVFGERGIGPGVRHGELACLRRDDTACNHGHNEAALT